MRIDLRPSVKTGSGLETAVGSGFEAQLGVKCLIIGLF